jgi:amino acid transporter
MTSTGGGSEKSSGVSRLWRFIVGAPRDFADPHIFHRLSLVAFLAWVGLGADGLSSSAYGPEEAYKALGGHTHLALVLFCMMAATIAMISIAYSNLIAHFPGGGGGYLVATKLLGNQFGVVSGCALLVDYVLTITISVASACDQMWSFLPTPWAPWKLPVEFVALGLLLLLNLRGVKESVTILAPIFLLFIVTHVFAILYAIAGHAPEIPGVVSDAAADLRSSIATLGWGPVLLILLRAYSLGGGTYTGIEAVSNGVATLREPRVQTARRTMALMAFSLAFTAGGILLGYLLTGAQPLPGRTMNSVFLSNLFSSWEPGGVAIGPALVIVSLFAEAALLFVAAQTGFLDGPRVLANMALDSWMPHRFAQLSERLVVQNGIVMMGVGAAAALLYTGGNVGTLVVMYAINVFITFSLSLLGMARHSIKIRADDPRWRGQLAIHGTGFVVCVTILSITIYEKLLEGGWITLAITGAVIALSYSVRHHYREVRRRLQRLDDVLIEEPHPRERPVAPAADPLDRKAPTAIICVSSFSGFGLHQVLGVHQLFPGHFKNFIFVSAAVLDSGVFKGEGEVGQLREVNERDLRKYVAWAASHGLRAEYRMTLATEAVPALEALCRDVVHEYPRSIVFMGKLLFREEGSFQNLLHNETALGLQRRLHFRGLQAIVLPIRVLDG